MGPIHRRQDCVINDAKTVVNFCGWNTHCDTLKYDAGGLGEPATTGIVWYIADMVECNGRD